MRAGRLFVNGKPETVLGDQEVQHRYIVTTGSQLDIPSLYNTYGFLPVQEVQTDKGYLYAFQGLTDKTAKEIKELSQVIDMKEEVSRKEKLPFITEMKPKLKLIPLSLSSCQQTLESGLVRSCKNP